MKTYTELVDLITQRGVHPVFGDAGEGWAVEQNPHELATFLVHMQELGVSTCLEIGTGYKGGFSRFLAADMGWQVTTVDIQDYGHKFKGVEYHIHPERLYTTYDLVFIDGNHGYKYVKTDYIKWGSYASKVVAFHDIAGLRACEGAQSFWDEIAHVHDQHLKRGCHEIIANNNQCSGIGYMELDKLN